MVERIFACRAMTVVRCCIHLTHPVNYRLLLRWTKHKRGKRELSGKRRRAWSGKSLFLRLLRTSAQCYSRIWFARQMTFVCHTHDWIVLQSNRSDLIKTLPPMYRWNTYRFPHVLGTCYRAGAMINFPNSKFARKNDRLRGDALSSINTGVECDKCVAFCD